MKFDQGKKFDCQAKIKVREVVQFNSYAVSASGAINAIQPSD